VNQRPYTVVLIVPTGIGAAIGVMQEMHCQLQSDRLLADRLITHPNVLNGAQLLALPNAFYVEGYGLDQFAAQRWGLRPVHQNRGFNFDQGIELAFFLQLQQPTGTACCMVADTIVRALLLAPVGVRLTMDSLLRAAEVLINRAEAEVVVRFPDDIDSPALQQYRRGQRRSPRWCRSRH